MAILTCALHIELLHHYLKDVEFLVHQLIQQFLIGAVGCIIKDLPLCYYRRSVVLLINLIKKAAATVFQLDDTVVSDVVNFMKGCLRGFLGLVVTHIKHVGMVDS